MAHLKYSSWFWYNLDFQVLDRGEKIELLVDKTENLRSQVMDSFMKWTLVQLILHVTFAYIEDSNCAIFLSTEP